MKHLILLAVLAVSASAQADPCIPLTGSDDFNRVSDTQLVVTDSFHTKYNVVVDSCPGLMMGDAIIIRSDLGELCTGDVLTVDHQICPIESITQL